MLSAARLVYRATAIGKAKTLSLAPQSASAGKIRSSLPPPPNDPTIVRTSTVQLVGGQPRTVAILAAGALQIRYQIFHSLRYIYFSSSLVDYY
ncbi:unnamed protein product [Linum trigynum]|uniref:Uncharacterized protein n=1 Tax=Linum trigynum TaxID=586398 RepID=A0AAV2FWW1_9ROSI